MHQEHRRLAKQGTDNESFITGRMGKGRGELARPRLKPETPFSNEARLWSVEDADTLQREGPELHDVTVTA